MKAVMILALLCALTGCASSPTKPDPVPTPAPVPAPTEFRRAELSWAPVSRAVDDTEVDDLTGYRLEITTPQGVTSINLPASATSHTIIAPTVGTYSFKLFAVSASRGESEQSNVVTKNFNE